MRHIDMDSRDKRIDVLLIALMAMLGIGLLLLGDRGEHYTIGICALAVCYIWGWMATHDHK